MTYKEKLMAQIQTLPQNGKYRSGVRDLAEELLEMTGDPITTSMLKWLSDMVALCVSSFEVIAARVDIACGMLRMEGEVGK